MTTRRRHAIHAALTCALIGCFGPWLLGAPWLAAITTATCGVMAAIGCASIAVAKYRNAACLALLVSTISLLISIYKDLPLMAPLFGHIPLRSGTFFLSSLIAVAVSAVVALLWEAE